MILVTGFGAFPGVVDNPTATLVRAVDGRSVRGRPVIGRVLPVAYERGPDEAVATARSAGAALVVGLGVAVGRERVAVEARAVRVCEGPDVDGWCPEVPGDGPEVVRSTLDVPALAAALGADVSHDAGRYVCNAWLYRVTRALDVPVGFVHVPPAGLHPERLLTGLRALLPDV